MLTRYISADADILAAAGWRDAARSRRTRTLSATCLCLPVPDPGNCPKGVVDLLPERANPGFRRAVRRIDQIYLQRTRPDPCVSPDAPWWERRY
jgi:hypothetical protein